MLLNKWSSASICFAWLLIFKMSPVANAQKIDESQGRSCEYNILILDILAGEVIKTKERLFVIARHGKGESRYWNHRRLYNVREFFRITFGNKLDKEQLCFAEGEKVEGAGEVRFYLGSKLATKVTFRPKDDFCVDCCELQVPYYYGRGKTDKPRKIDRTRKLRSSAQ